MAALRQDDIDRAATAVSRATHLFIGAGAGASADSGLPVFAQISSQKLLVSEGLTYDQVASSDMLGKDPARCLGFWLAAPYADVEPHEGYHIMTRWRKRVASSWVVTSNVDGFFNRTWPAGREHVAEIHGSLERWQCGGVPSGQRFPLWKSARCQDTLFDPPVVTIDPATQRVQGDLPRCPACSEGILRPHVYLFGDGDRFVADELTTRHNAMRQWQEEVVSSLRDDPDSRLVIVELGCGLRVPSIRKRCEELLLAGRKVAGADTDRVEFIRVNPDYPDNPLVASPTIQLQSSALDALEAIDKLLPP